MIRGHVAPRPLSYINPGYANNLPGDCIEMYSLHMDHIEWIALWKPIGQWKKTACLLTQMMNATVGQNKQFQAYCYFRTPNQQTTIFPASPPYRESAYGP